MTIKTQTILHDQASYKKVDGGVLKTIIADAGYYVGAVYEKIRATSTPAKNIVVLYKILNNQRFWNKIKKQLKTDMVPAFIVFRQSDDNEPDFMVVTSGKIKYNRDKYNVLIPDVDMQIISSHNCGVKRTSIFDTIEPCSANVMDDSKKLWMEYLDSGLEFISDTIDILEKELLEG